MIKDEELRQLDSQLKDLVTLRKQAIRLLELAREDKLTHFYFHEDKLKDVASFVLEVIKDQYPKLDIPYHSRFRHFEVGGIDRIKKLKQQFFSINDEDWGKMLYELTIISVLLDAGAGAAWQFSEKSSGQVHGRSEGLALASLELYQQGFFSSHPNAIQVDAKALKNFSKADFIKGFQISEQNPLLGIEGRLQLLKDLGDAIQNNPNYFGKEGRLGDFYSYVLTLVKANQISATTLFNAVLEAFKAIWPKRLNYEGLALGDIWIHSALKKEQKGSELIPFHKLSQWLTYSLIEPLELIGIKVSDLDTLTGLAEYRNGGLFIDLGVLEPKDAKVLIEQQEANSELIVEWRALTVILLDELAKLIRKHLDKGAEELPLAKILQGGTWEAGRRIAKMKRPNGNPPIQIKSDGTLF
ncbi:MAG: URC4/urg3 family protein [Proteobacteria bacterium]|nr:URC4/urg3 family protein [Pseudomonadota bacterium]